MKDPGPNRTTLSDGGNSAELEILRRRVLEEELRSCREKSELLMECTNEAIGVVQKLAGQTQRIPRMEMAGKAMVAGLAHDLRNPLAVIHSCAQICLDTPRISRPFRKNLEMIQESSQKANSLLRQFLDFVKSGLNRQLTDIHELLLRAWDSAQLDAKNERVALESHLSKDVPPVLVDPEKLERVFVNLFLNALRVLPAGGTVTIQSRFLDSENCVLLEVIDDGPGIPADQRERVFEPFFTTQKNGVGLGLFLCQSFIRNHHGTITIDGGEVGGTKVTVKLPVDGEDKG